jgi:hypothetical protein
MFYLGLDDREVQRSTHESVPALPELAQGQQGNAITEQDWVGDKRLGYQDVVGAGRPL